MSSMDCGYWSQAEGEVSGKRTLFMLRADVAVGCSSLPDRPDLRVSSDERRKPAAAQIGGYLILVLVAESHLAVGPFPR